MNAKKILAVIFSAGIIATTGVVSASAYDKSYSSGYSYTATSNASGTTTKVLSMWYHHSSPYIYTSSTNRSGNYTYTESIAATYTKAAKEVSCDEQREKISNNCAIVATCSDYRSKSTNVYYRHIATVCNSSGSSIISSISKTVG